MTRGQINSVRWLLLVAMPGGIRSPGRDAVLGLKVINGSLSNPARGLARAQGLVMVFDPLTARPARPLRHG